MEGHEIQITKQEGTVVAKSGNIQIVVDAEGKIITDRNELTHHEYINDAETEIAVDIIRQTKPVPVVPLKVYFQHIKASLMPIDELRLRPYMERLSRVSKHMKSLGQIGGYEEATKRLLIAAREIDFKVNHGVNFSIAREAVEEWIPHTMDKSGTWYSRRNAPVKLKNFKDFPRLIPKHIEDIIKEFQEKEIFDNFEIVYIDTSGQDEDVGDTGQFRSRDPILFGTIEADPNRFYYITAWDDEHCDLTFDEMVENANFEEGDFTNIPEADEITEEYINELEKEVIKVTGRRMGRPSFGPVGTLPEVNPETGRAPSRVWERVKAKLKWGEKH